VPTLSPVLTRTRKTHATPLALWHLLSLDAPTVAALWTYFIAASIGIQLPRTSILAMSLAVWMLYAADRLLDARHLLSNPLHTGDLEHRHRFHHRHRTPFLAGILLASAALAVLIPRLHPATLHLDLILGALLAGYFILIHATGSAHRLPKEIAVGLFFSAAVFLPTIARAPALRPNLAPAAALFALLCSLNCLFIYAWEHTPNRISPSSLTATPHPATQLALHHLPALAWLSLATNTGFALLSYFRANTTAQITPWTIPAATAASSALLLALNRHRPRLTPLTLRAAADLALLTPVLLLPTLH